MFKFSFHKLQIKFPQTAIENIYESCIIGTQVHIIILCTKSKGRIIYNFPNPLGAVVAVIVW